MTDAPVDLIANLKNLDGRSLSCKLLDNAL